MFEIDKKPPKKQITFRLEESTIKRLKQIDKYNSKVDMLLNFALDNFEKSNDTLNILSNDDLEQIKRILHYETFMRMEIDSFSEKLKLRHESISQGKSEELKIEYFEKVKRIEDEFEMSRLRNEKMKEIMNIRKLRKNEELNDDKK